METDPIPHVIIDVREPEDVSLNPLPEDLKAAVHIPGDLLVNLSDHVHPNKVNEYGNVVSLHCPD